MLNKLLAKKRKEKKVLLIAGHHRAGITKYKPFWHPKDTGAPAAGTCEHYEMEKLTYHAAEILLESGYDVELCPFTYDLRQKIDWANEQHPDSVLVSCHMNALNGEATGVEAWYLSGNKEMENTAHYAIDIISKYLNISKRYPRGDLQSHHGRLGVLRGTHQMDELLLEIGFIDNKKDLDQVRKFGAQAVADVVRQIFYFKNKR